MIGFVRFTIYHVSNLNAFLSIVFLKKEHFFAAEGKEAGILMFDYLFRRKNLFRIWTKVIEEERDCLDYLLRLGFKLDGIQKKQVFLRGRYLDLCTLGILRDEAKWGDTGHD